VKDIETMKAAQIKC